MVTVFRSEKALVACCINLVSVVLRIILAVCGQDERECIKLPLSQTPSHAVSAAAPAAQTLRSSSSDNGDGNENVISKNNFSFLYLFRDY